MLDIHFKLLLIGQTAVNHHENIGFLAGIVVAESLEIFAGLEGLALGGVDVAEQNESAGYPIAVGRT